MTFTEVGIDLTMIAAFVLPFLQLRMFSKGRMTSRGIETEAIPTKGNTLGGEMTISQQQSPRMEVTN